MLTQAEVLTYLAKKFLSKQTENLESPEGVAVLRRVMKEARAKVTPRLVRVEKGGLAYAVASLAHATMRAEQEVRKAATKQQSQLLAALDSVSASRTPEEIEEEIMFMAALMFTPVGIPNSQLDVLRWDIFGYENITQDHPQYYSKHTLCHILMVKVKTYFTTMGMRLAVWARGMLSEEVSLDDVISAAVVALTFSQIVSETLNIVSKPEEEEKELSTDSLVVAELSGLSISYVANVLRTAVEK